MTVPQEERLARHAGDLDEYGHDVHPGYTPMMDEGDLVTFTLTDRALAGTAYADTTFGGQTPDLANDGDDATYHLSLDPVAGRWLAVDLLDIYSITAWRAKQGASSTERADTWRLESSPDYVTWTTRDSGTVFTDTGVRLLSETVTARYWRLYPVTGGADGWALFTLSIYSGEQIRLPVGTEGEVMTIVGGVPAYAPGSAATIAAADVTVADAGAYFAAAEVEAALQEAMAKLIGHTAHGAMGATETFSALVGSHSGTFDANCTFTFSGGTKRASLLLELESDGTSVPTWPSGGVWAGGTEPTLSTTPGDRDFILILTRDNFTTWYGFPTGGSGGTSGRWELAVITGSPPDPLYADGDFLYILVP